MPCIGGPSREDEERSRLQQTFDRQLSEIRSINNHLSACLCALLSEIELEGSTHLITAAENNGDVDIHIFWDKHKNDDFLRLGNELKKFSVHEREVLKKILTT